MRLPKTIFYPLIFPLLLLVASCKDAPAEFPVVEILSPRNVPRIEFGDTLLIEARISAAEGGIAVSVLNNGEEMAFGGRLVDRSGERFSYELYYNNRYLPGGIFPLRVLAINGSHQAADLIDIEVAELSLEQTGLVLLSSSAPYELQFWDRDGTLWQQGLSGDYQHLVVNAQQQIATVASVDNFPLRGFELPQLKPAYQQPLPAGINEPQYSALFAGFPLTYALEERGELKGLTAGGAVDVSYPLASGRRPLNGIALDEGLLLASEVKGTQSFELHLLNPGNGFMLQSAGLTARPVALAEVSQGRVVILAAKNGHSQLYLYNLNSNLLTLYDEVFNEIPLSLCSPSGDVVVFSTDQNIYRLDLLSFLSPERLHTFAATTLHYDPISQRIYYLQGSVITAGKAGDPPQLIYSAGIALKDFAISYNK